MPAGSTPSQPSTADSAYALTINNSGNQAATFMVTVPDVAPEWLIVSPPQCHLQPNEQTQVTIRLHPDLPPALYTVTWLITSPQYTGWQQSGQVTLGATTVIEPIEWAELDPRTVQSRLFRRSGRCVLTLTNRGAQPVQYHLWAKDLRGDCRVYFGLTPEGKQITTLIAEPNDACTVLLPPGVGVPLELTLMPAQGRIIALQAVRFRFVIQGGFSAGDLDRAVTGTFESRPVINGGILILLSTLLLVLGVIFFHAQIGAWFDQWRFAQGQESLPTYVIGPTPELIYGFSAEELARYGLNAPAGTGGAEQAPRVIPGNYEGIFKEIGRQYNIDWRILAALSYRESKLDARAVGRSGEYGLMQIMPNTWNEWAPLVRVSDPWDGYSNVLVGAAYYSYIHDYFSDLGYSDDRWALAAYNLGPERVLRILDNGARWQDLPLPQRQYVADILLGIDDAPAQVASVDATRAP